MSGHSDSGGHQHSHDNTPGGAAGDRRRLATVLAITTTILLVEVVGAVVLGSLALLLADAGHMLTDAAGLVIALIAAALAVLSATDRRTWGYQRAEVLAATAQAVVLLAVGVFVLVEGARRLFEPPTVSSGGMVVFWVVGLAGNLASMLVLIRGAGGGGGTFNMRAAVLEVANDALGSVAVLVGALVIATTGWLRADAVVSIGIGLLILPFTVRLLRDRRGPARSDLARARPRAGPRAHALPRARARCPRRARHPDGTGLPVLTAHLLTDDSCFLDGHAPRMLSPSSTPPSSWNTPATPTTKPGSTPDCTRAATQRTTAHSRRSSASTKPSHSGSSGRSRQPRSG